MEIVFSGGKRVDARFGEFTVKTDQSPRGGGDGSAPEPFDLFLASMGTCAGIYVLSYCQHHDLSHEGIRLLQRVKRDPDTNYCTLLNIDIVVPPTFPEKYRGALVRSAGLCAVKKHVAKGLPEFEVKVIEEGEVEE